MKLLITGGAGFIGSHLVDRRLARGDRVTVLDAFDDFYAPAAKRENVAPHLDNPRFRLVEGDIRDRALLSALFRGEAFDAVAHLAGRVGVRPSIREPELYEAVNVLGTRNVLEAAAAHGKPRFLLASSSSVYGVNTRLPFAEDDPTDHTISPYAATKRAAEVAVADAHRLHGLPAVCLRLFTVYGPRQRPEMAIARFLRAIEAGEAIPFYGDGGSRRDYTYVEDVVDGIEAALEAPLEFETINLGGARPVTLARLVREIEAVTGKKARLDRLPDQPGDVPVTFAATEKAERLLGFRARVALPEGLRRLVAWQRSKAAA